MLEDSLISTVLSKALVSGGEFAELFAEKRHSQSLRLEAGSLEEVSSGFDVGAGVRVIVGDRTGYAFTNVLTLEGLLEAASAAAASVSGEGKVTPVDLRRRDPARMPTIIVDPFEPPAQKKAELLWRIDDTARSASGDIKQVAAMFSATRREVLIANSEGVRAEDSRTLTMLGGFAVAAADGKMEMGSDLYRGSVGFELVDDHPPEEIGAEAARIALNNLRAISAPAGEMPVVLASKAQGVLFHEACGHPSEADAVVKGSSIFAKLAGQKIAPDHVTIVDSALYEGGTGSFAFDDEGTPAQRTVIVDKGVVSSYLIDRLRSRKLGKPPTGNGRRETYEHVPIPRMTNTYLESGDADPDEIVRDTKRGVWVGRFAGGQVTPVTGDFVFGVTEGYLIENGELTTPIKGANLIGDAPTILSRIDAVGSDFEMGSGTCGKDGQWAPAGTGQPTLRVSKLTVGGTQ